MSVHVEIRRGEYHDSVTLLNVSRSVAQLEGVDDALVAMATELNLGLLTDLGFGAARVTDASANDLLIAVRAAHQDTIDLAMAEVDRNLRAVSPPGSSEDLAQAQTPRTARRVPGTDLVLISVPGENAFVEAMDALRAGSNVMVFSDNVPIAHETSLKAEGRRRGLLVMGPDCGTAIVGGIGLGFANVTQPGPVGIVAASGTGAQQLCCLLDDAGVGVRHVLGVGGRDLAGEVGGISTMQALEALDADPAVELIVVISKPPDNRVAERVKLAACECATPVSFGFTGRGRRDLTAVASEAARALGRPPVTPRSWPAATRHEGRYEVVRGLFSGGTLCDEAMAIVADELGPVRSNIPLEPGWALSQDLHADGQVFIDFGDDALTRGRPHPMIDNEVRLMRLAEEAASGARKVVLLDVVLGHGAHPDPASDLAPGIKKAIASARELAVIVSLCGTSADPQDRKRQAELLVEAGASVHLSNAEATRAAVALVQAEAQE